MSPAGSIFRLGEQIGTGAFSHVFRAEETSTGRIVALKKSRASLKVKRTLVYHEVRIMRLLAGHPSIPAVFAYGHLEHFEYMAIELLGKSLDDIFDEQGIFSLQYTLQVADQMLSAFEHIHSLRIVHRDIKLSNIMTQINDTAKFRLIDFGMARPCVLGELNTLNLFEERRSLVGTLTWASLNAHQGIDLAPRDDLESLAYVLLFALRGEVPWEKNCDHGTALGRLAHVREKKRAWPGARLAQGHPAVFGELVDYARGLSYDEPIEYGRFCAKFAALQSRVEAVLDSEPNSPDNIICTSTSVRLDQDKPQPYAECPVEVGQLILVQILAKTTIEGHSMRAHDPSYWNNTALSSEEWRTAVRPAVVINTTFEKWSSLHTMIVVSLARGVPEDEASVVRITPSNILPAAEGDEVKKSCGPWPFCDAYCYAFPRATLFHCLPDQPHVIPHWKADPDTTQLLRSKFGKSYCPAVRRDEDPDRDIRYDTRMAHSGVKFFVSVTELGGSLEADLFDHEEGKGHRTWFDERAKIARRRAWDDGPYWTGAPTHEEEDSDTSYFEPDFEMWDYRQEERNRSLTLLPDQQEIYEQVCLNDELLYIVEVI